MSSNFLQKRLNPQIPPKIYGRSSKEVPSRIVFFSKSSAIILQLILMGFLNKWHIAQRTARGFIVRGPRRVLGVLQYLAHWLFCQLESRTYHVQLCSFLFKFKINFNKYEFSILRFSECLVARFQALFPNWTNC